MADRRLLIRAFVTTICSLACAGCLASHLPRVAGRVIDAETGKGVEGAGVYLIYDVQNALAFFGEPGGTAFDGGWTLTDSEGRFEFPARWTAEGGPVGIVDGSPLVTWVHPQYGWGSNDPEVPGHGDLENLEFRAMREERLLRSLRNPVLGDEPCSFTLEESRAKCIALMYPSVEESRP